MPQPNRRLRAARDAAGLSRYALAEAVCRWLTDRDPQARDVAFDVTHLGKLERGVIARPRAHYISASAQFCKQPRLNSVLITQAVLHQRMWTAKPSCRPHSAPAPAH